MGHRMLEQQEDQARVAMDIAIKAKAVRVCEYHGMAYDLFDPEGLSLACQIANSMWSKGQIDAGLFASRRELTDAIKAAIGESALSCTANDCPNG